jgi:hypothetical protein
MCVTRYTPSKRQRWVVGKLPSPPTVAVTERGRWERHLRWENASQKRNGKELHENQKVWDEIMDRVAESIYKLVGRGIAA